MDMSYKRKRKNWLRNTVVAAVLLGGTPISQAGEYSHSYIENTRSGMVTHYYIGSSVENEATKFIITRDGKEKAESWRGYGLNTELGMELLKFMRISINHAFMTAKSESARGVDTTGQRVGLSNYFIFSSPVGNLEMGGGLNVSRYEFQEGYDRANIYGQNTYFGLGVNYFLSYSSSVFVRFRSGSEDGTYGSGPAIMESMKGKLEGISLGMCLWQ
jgi:hypothetical protein